MRKLLASLAIVMASLFALGSPTMADPPDVNEEQVTICHRTNADENPYVEITVDRHAVDGLEQADHYGEHQGPLYNDTLKAQHIEWGDIIPPVFPYHTGLNWTVEGIAVYNGHCAIPPTTTSTTVPETTTTTVLEETTTTVKVDDSVTSTTGRRLIAQGAVAPAELPRTGLSDGEALLVAVGVLLIVVGALALRARRLGGWGR